MVTILLDQEPVTPGGKPVMLAPVAPVVANVIVVMAVLIHVVRLIPATIVFWLTVIVPVANSCGVHPVNRML